MLNLYTLILVKSTVIRVYEWTYVNAYVNGVLIFSKD